MTAFDLVVRGRVARMGGRAMPCAIGRGGIGQKRGEGDGITPVGRFRVLEWRLRRDRVGHGAGQAIGPSHRWSDDPADPLYNRMRRWPEPGLSSERMHRPDGLYDIIGVLDFNLPEVRAGAGSAIFLHVWRGPGRATEGCIAFARADLAWIKTRWRPWSRVRVLR